MWLLMLGHILGDYFFQTKKMALTKTVDFITCYLHCLIYTICIGLCLLSYTLVLSMEQRFCVWTGIFVTHFFIDYYSLGTKWLQFIKGRTFDTAQDDWDKIFTSIVYVVVDNTMHILCIVGLLLLVGIRL